MGGKFYAISLFLACLAALLLGYACGGQLEQNPPSNRLKTPETVTDYKTVEKYGIEAQGSYLSYEEYEADVMGQINDRGVNDN